MIWNWMSQKICHFGVKYSNSVLNCLSFIMIPLDSLIQIKVLINDPTLLLDLFGNSEGTKLLIWTVIFVWCLLRQRNGGWNSGQKPAAIVTDALVFSSKILVYMPLEPYLSNSLYKSFLTMAFAIRSPMQWRPSNRKLAVYLTGNEINKAYNNMNIDCRTREFVLFCDN